MQLFLSRITLLLFVLSISAQTFAVDPFNTYRFNRKNYDAGNGRIKEKTWYEWWYYKVVLPETGESFYFVYGVVNPWDKTNKLKGTRSYVGMGDFSQKINFEQEFEVDEFEASYEKTFVTIAGNEATDKRIQANLQDKNGDNFSWDISIHNNWTFNPVGWATGRMITNIEWYTAQADATCSGQFISKGKLIQFTDAPCYQDRNWGYTFPKWWTWIVSNHFDGHPDTALAIGGGHPKVLGLDIGMKGVAVGLKHKGKEYAFRPNDFDHVAIDINFGKWEVTAYDRNYKVEVSAYAPPEKFMDLQFMSPNGVIFHDYEALNGDLTLKLYKRQKLKKKKWLLIDTLTSNFAGIEYGSFDGAHFNKMFNNKMNIYKVNP